jgi:hypothetical protein
MRLRLFLKGEAPGSLGPKKIEWRSYAPTAPPLGGNDTVVLTIATTLRRGPYYSGY